MSSCSNEAGQRMTDLSRETDSSCMKSVPIWERVPVPLIPTHTHTHTHMPTTFIKNGFNQAPSSTLRMCSARQTPWGRGTGMNITATSLLRPRAFARNIKLFTLLDVCVCVILVQGPC